jgi:hypothetical protein
VNEPYLIDVALQLVNTRLGVVDKLPQISVEAFDEPHIVLLVERMRAIGWEVTLKSILWNDTLSEEDDDYPSEADSDNDLDESLDDYDIDNDSDFWSRAAD